MGVLQVILVFIAFCVIGTGFEIAKDIARAKMMKRTIDQSIDTAFSSVIRSMMKYRLDAKTVFSKPDKEVE